VLNGKQSSSSFPGTWFETGALPTTQRDRGPVEELFYGYSMVCCLPDGMSHG
jgi:hypothetical protein